MMQMMSASERGRGQRNFIGEAVHNRQRVKNCLFGMMRTDADTFAAIDTPLLDDFGLAAAHADRLGGTAFDTVDAAVTFVAGERYGVKKIRRIHADGLPSVGCKKGLIELLIKRSAPSY